MSAHSSQRRMLYLVLGLTISACLGVWFATPFPVRLASAILLAFFLPGWSLLQAVGLNTRDRLQQLVLVVGTSYGLVVLSSLGALYMAGRLSASLMIGVLALMVFVLVMVCMSRSTTYSASRPLARLDIFYFSIPVAVAAFFSFANLGYSDYWGDEMNSLLRAVSIIAGRRDTLFEHTKGPAEVLLPAVFGLLVGRFEPFTLRFPFALAHTVGAGGYYLLARRLFDRNVGLFAALVLAVNGLYLAFGRIIQYQAVVFLMTGLSMLMAYHFYRGEKGIYLGLSLFLAGVGLLAHYDMLLVLPPIGYLVWRRYGWRRADWSANWQRLMGAAIILLAVVTLFYAPFLLHPHLERTSSYLSRIVGVSNWPASNLDELYVFAVMYNSVYYVAFITLLGVGTTLAHLVRLFHDKRRDRKLWLMVMATFMLCLLAIVVDRTSFVPLLFFVLLFGVLIGFASVVAEFKLIYVWVGVAFVGYLFFVDHPRTHLQVIYPGWSLLVAMAAKGAAFNTQTRLIFLRRRWTTTVAVILACFLFGLFARYEYLLFGDVKREYILTYPSLKSSVYWEDPDFPFGSRRMYGAPHRLGWQMINHLYTEGYLQGDWDSNDYGSNLFWYTLGSPRHPCYPRYYFLTQFEQREGASDSSPDVNLADYVQIGQVWNRDRLQINVYEFAPFGIPSSPVGGQPSQGAYGRVGMGHDNEVAIWSEPIRYTSFVTPDRFYSLPYEEASPDISNFLAVPSIFRPGLSALEGIASHYGDPRIVNVRDKVALVGYDLDDTWAEQGGLVVLTLYWQAAEVVNLPYKIFVHLESIATGEGVPELWAQADDYPACGTRSTQRWQVGEIVTDRHIIRVPADAPRGDYLLRVGLYEPKTGLRMDLLDSLGSPRGTSFGLARVTVRAAD